MSFYEAARDAMNLAQKADNIELYRQLLDLSVQAWDLQTEIARLREENEALRKHRDIADQIVRHVEPCITLKSDDKEIYYCSHCWDSEQLLIQLNCRTNGTFECSHCHAKGNYSNEKKKQSDIAQVEAMAKINRVRRNPYV